VLFTIARQNDPANTPLFEGLPISSTLLPTKLIAHEVLARIGDPLLWAFVQNAQKHADDWGTAQLERITSRCGTERPDIWTLSITPAGAPALISHLDQATVGTLLRDPQDRSRELDVVALLRRRGDDITMTPGDDEPLSVGDDLLLVGRSYDRRALDTTVSVPTAAEYVLTGDRVGQSWIWRTLVDR
jgi:hypothetical protein